MIAFGIQLRYVIRDKKIQSEKKSEKKFFCPKRNLSGKKFVSDFVAD